MVDIRHGRVNFSMQRRSNQAPCHRVENGTTHLDARDSIFPDPVKIVSEKYNATFVRYTARFRPVHDLTVCTPQEEQYFFGESGTVKLFR